MKLEIGTAPDSWGVWFPSDEQQIEALREVMRAVVTLRALPVRGLRGLRFIRSFSGGSIERASAGRPSVARFT